MAQNVELNAGELVVFTQGEYSDYGFSGHFVALRDVSADEMEALAVYGFYHASNSFLARAIQQGWLLSVNVREIHYGSYGDLNLS
jgi:hypothetical protein